MIDRFRIPRVNPCKTHCVSWAPDECLQNCPLFVLAAARSLGHTAVIDGQLGCEDAACFGAASRTWRSDASSILSYRPYSLPGAVLIPPVCITSCVNADSVVCRRDCTLDKMIFMSRTHSHRMFPSLSTPMRSHIHSISVICALTGLIRFRETTQTGPI